MDFKYPLLKHFLHFYNQIIELIFYIQDIFFVLKASLLSINNDEYVYKLIQLPIINFLFHHNKYNIFIYNIFTFIFIPILDTHTQFFIIAKFIKPINLYLLNQFVIIFAITINMSIHEDQGKNIHINQHIEFLFDYRLTILSYNFYLYVKLINLSKFRFEYNTHPLKKLIVGAFTFFIVVNYLNLIFPGSLKNYFLCLYFLFDSLLS